MGISSSSTYSRSNAQRKFPWAHVVTNSYRHDSRADHSFSLLFGLSSFEDEPIGYVVFVDVTHILHGFTAYALGGHHLHVVEPDIGVEAHFLGFLPQL